MAGTDSTARNITGGPAIVLVAPQLGENIGTAARAMANFGLDDLRLVSPRDGWPNERAAAAASNATHVVEGARVFGTLGEAVADLSFVWATTARNRGLHKPVRGPEEAMGEAHARTGAGQRVGILFGRERTGLETEEITLADEIVTFAVNPAHASLNIAQAVLLMGHEWFRALGEAGRRETFRAFDHAPAEKRELHGLLAQLEDMLERRRHFAVESREAMQRANIRSALTRPQLTRGEVHLLRGVLKDLDRFDAEGRDVLGPTPRGAAGREGSGQGRSGLGGSGHGGSGHAGSAREK